jgi:hypothetical protein
MFFMLLWYNRTAYLILCNALSQNGKVQSTTCICKNVSVTLLSYCNTGLIRHREKLDRVNLG